MPLRFLLNQLIKILEPNMRRRIIEVFAHCDKNIVRLVHIRHVCHVADKLFDLSDEAIVNKFSSSGNQNLTFSLNKK